MKLLRFAWLCFFASSLLGAQPPVTKTTNQPPRTLQRKTNAVPIRQPLTRAAFINTNLITPTVTAQMGDVGGKFFGQVPDPAKTRHYYIAVEPELWDFVPESKDPVCGKPIPPEIQQKKVSGKLRYVEYTDATFTTRMLAEPRIGIMGPVLRGMVGEFIAVTLINRTSRAISMHPHGVRYDKDSEGALYYPNPGKGAALGENAKFTYVWQLHESSGPRPHEPSSKAWLYHSHVRGDEEANMGLVGCIIVTDPKRARPDGTPADIDREMAALFMMFDESGEEDEEEEATEAVEYSRLGIAPPEPKPWPLLQELIELGQRHAINGRLFGNLRGLEMNQGERVRWYLFGLGSEEDFHTAHWHGLTIIEENRRQTDVVDLLPATMKVADMLADNPGAWLFHCHVAEHMTRGMFANFTVHPTNSAGVSREPKVAFLGLKGSQESLRIKKANLETAANGECKLTLEAESTVYHAYSIFVEPITLTIAGKTFKFQPTRDGTAKIPSGDLKVLNASKFGVVYGGILQFQATLAAPDWCAYLRNNTSSLEIQVETARATHKTKTAIK